jgi:hypothetical protein
MIERARDPQSRRSVTAGSILAARSAGTAHAASAVIVSRVGATTSVGGAQADDSVHLDGDLRSR